MAALSLEHIRSTFAQPASRQTLHIEGYQKAAVLVPLCTDPGLELLFTKRTETVETHKGQISFPGGVVDETDSEIVETALREADEEVGLHRSCIEVIGMLDDMATPTGFIITPVVGIICSSPQLTINHNEVAEVFRGPLSFFVDEKNGRKETRRLLGTDREVWFFEFEGHTIWGATAVIIRSLFGKLAGT